MDDSHELLAMVLFKTFGLEIYHNLLGIRELNAQRLHMQSIPSPTLIPIYLTSNQPPNFYFIVHLNLLALCDGIVDLLCIDTLRQPKVHN